MSNVFGLFFFVVFIACVVVAAAGITWLVVRISPAKKPDATPKP